MKFATTHKTQSCAKMCQKYTKQNFDQDKQNKILCTICQNTQNETFKLNVSNTQTTIFYWNLPKYT
jgi:hypothetical protein